MSAIRCLSAWYEADGAPEGLAVLGVLECHLEHGVRGTDRLRTLQRHGESELELDLARSARWTGPTTDEYATSTPSKRTRENRRVRSRLSSGSTATPGASPGDQELGYAPRRPLVETRS